MITTQNKLHFVALTAILLLSSMGIYVGNYVSFADTSKSINNAQSVKEKAQYNAERIYFGAITKAKLNYAKSVELATDNPDKLRQAKIDYNKLIQIANNALNKSLSSTNEQYKKSMAKNTISPQSENNSEVIVAKLVYSKAIKDAKILYGDYLSIITSNYEKVLQAAKTDSSQEKIEATYEFQLKTAKDVYNKTLIDAKQSLDETIANAQTNTSQKTK